MMNQINENWVNSLSCVSFMGPDTDIKLLKRKGFYLHTDQEPLLKSRIRNIPMQERVLFTEAFKIKSKEARQERMQQLLRGDFLFKDINRIFHEWRLVDVKDRKQEKIDLWGRKYPGELINYVMAYEHDWPKTGLIAYSMSNAALLLRYIRGLDKIPEDIDKEIQEHIGKWVLAHYSSFEEFGRDAAIGREIHIKLMSKMLLRKELRSIEPVLGKAYYGIWRYMEWPDL